MMRRIVIGSANAHEMPKPISLLFRIASAYDCDIHVQDKAVSYNLKDAGNMWVMRLKAGEIVTLKAIGKDENEALDKVSGFLTSV